MDYLWVEKGMTVNLRRVHFRQTLLLPWLTRTLLVLCDCFQWEDPKRAKWSEPLLSNVHISVKRATLSLICPTCMHSCCSLLSWVFRQLGKLEHIHWQYSSVVMFVWGGRILLRSLNHTQHRVQFGVRGPKSWIHCVLSIRSCEATWSPFSFKIKPELRLQNWAVAAEIFIIFHWVGPSPLRSSNPPLLWLFYKIPNFSRVPEAPRVVLDNSPALLSSWKRR